VTSKRGFEDNIKIDLIETGTEDMNCIRELHDRTKLWALGMIVMNIHVLEDYEIS
jgi:hypothetical protein